MSILNLTYFEIFDMSVDISIDMDDLNQKYLKLQSKFHPDKYASASNIEKTMAVRISTHVNDAYKTLSDLVLRVDYILKINNFSISDHQTFKNKNFLSEQLELSEKIDNADKSKISIIENEINNKIINLTSEMKSNLVSKDLETLYDNISMIKFYQNNINKLKD